MLPIPTWVAIVSGILLFYLLYQIYEQRSYQDKMLMFYTQQYLLLQQQQQSIPESLPLPGRSFSGDPVQPNMIERNLDSIQSNMPPVEMYNN